MENIKAKVEELFLKHLDRIDLTYFKSSGNLDIEALKLKLNTVVENLCEDKALLENIYQVPLRETSNNNSYKEGIEDIAQDKSSDIELNNYHCYEPSGEIDRTISQTIPSSFMLSYEMRQFAKSKFVQDVDEMFEDFKLYYQSKGTVNSDWEAVWKRWVLNQNKYKKHLVKTTIDEDMSLKEEMRSFAKKYINNEDIETEFLKFKNYYISNGDLKVSWEKVWENWCMNNKKFTAKEQSNQSYEKANYRWDFRKAKDVSDRIKDWLEFEKGINWLEDFYLKDIPIPGIGWQEVIHPDFNKEEILLYKIDSQNGQFMLNHKSDDVVDVEVLEND